MVGLVGVLVAEVIAGLETCLVQLLERWLQRREVQPQVALHDARPERCGELGGLGVVWRDRVPRPGVGLGHGDEARLLAALHVAVPDLGVVLDVLVALRERRPYLVPPMDVVDRSKLPL